MSRSNEEWEWVKTTAIYVGLDIGTSKVVALVAELAPDGQFNRLALAKLHPKVLEEVVVVNIEATVQSIQKALEEAEVMADRQIVQVFTGIAGNHIEFNWSGMVAIRDKEVSAGADVERVLETAKAINIPTDKFFTSLFKNSLLMDMEDARKPIGMSGLRLEVKVHIVTGAVMLAKYCEVCASLWLRKLMIWFCSPWLRAKAVLTEDEKELGVVLVDIGGGTTDTLFAVRVLFGILQ